MAFTLRKKSPIFTIPSYLPAKKGKMKDKIDRLIEETIQEKIFNLMNINRRVYIKMIEYFVTYKPCSKDGKKIASFNLRLRNKPDKTFLNISALDIELSGVSLVEFNNFLESNNAKKYKSLGKALEEI